MRSLTYVIALFIASFIVGCTSQASDAGQKVAAKSGNVSVVERRPDQPNHTQTPAAAYTMLPAATKAEVASPPSIQPTVTTQESTTTLAPIPSATVMPTATAIPTTAPTATAMPSTARPAAEIIADSVALVEQGIKVYQEQYCGICHQLDAAGTAGMFGPTHNGFAQTAEQRLRDPLYAGTARTAREYVRESILNPESYLVGGYELSSHHMPAYVNLSDTDLEALVQLLLQQK